LPNTDACAAEESHMLTVTNPPVMLGDEKRVIVNPPAGNLFFRLHKP
jgi:hypothetical protein